MIWLLRSFGKHRAGLLPVAPALAPDERIGAHAAFAEPGPHQIAGGRAELSSRRRPNVPDHFRRLGDRVGRFRRRQAANGRGRRPRARRERPSASDRETPWRSRRGRQCRQQAASAQAAVAQRLQAMAGRMRGRAEIDPGTADQRCGTGMSAAAAAGLWPPAGRVGGATTGPLPDGVPTGVLGPSILPPLGSPGRLGGSPGRISGEESEAWADSGSSCSMVCVAACAAPWRPADFEAGRVLCVGIWVLAPQNGQIPSLPA